MDIFSSIVIGAGQAGLSGGYYLKKAGLENFVILDHAPRPGGAWQFRWPSLTLATANRIHDLPGWGLTEALGESCEEIPAATGVPEYFGRYETRFGLPVRRPVHVRSVRDADDGFSVDLVRRDENGVATEETLLTRTVISATGTWDRPFWPTVKGSGSFAGRQLHAHEYRTAAGFAGKRVLVIGAGITAVQLLIEIAAVTQTQWVTRRPPEFDDSPFDPNKGRAAVARVEERVRAGLAPGSVVSVTGLPVNAEIRAARASGVLERREMFTEIVPDGVRFPDGSFAPADVLLWCTGFRPALDHLAPLRLRAPRGGIVMGGRLATEVVGRPDLHLLGYGPSASTIGANRAGREAARAIIARLPPAAVSAPQG